MAETNSRTQDPVPPRVWASFFDAATSQATTQLYEVNPFRRLGISTLASTRDVSKRIDQLQLALQIGSAAWEWAFAPRTPPSPESLRAATQWLKSPQQRFLAEFFWFWPESYPLEGSDAAMDFLAANNVAEAVNYWASKSADESPAALHNLTIFHHLTAIEQETASLPVPDDDKSAWWRAAVRYWATLLAHERTWELLQERARALADPQLPVDLVPRFRKALPEVLSLVNSSLALRFAEQGNTAGAARQVAVLGDIHSDSAVARRSLERGVAPVVRRIDVQVAEAKRVSANEPASGLGAAKTLVLHTLPDIRILETLCGGEATFFAETSTLVAGTALDAIVAYQRATSDDASCLPLLTYLRSLRLTPEAEDRVARTFEVMFENATIHVRDRAEGGEADSETPRYASRYDVLREYLLPGLLSLDLGEKALSEASGVAAKLLRHVAVEARDERDDIDFALHALQTLIQLPAGEDERAARERERDEFERRFREQKAQELRLQIGNAYLEVTRRGVFWADRLWRPDEITALRFGTITAEDDPSSVLDHVIAVKAGAEEQFVLNRETFFTEPELLPTHYAQVVDAVNVFIVPNLVERIVSTVRQGAVVTIGDASLRPNGVVLPTRSRFWKREQELPYDRVAHRVEDGAWIMASSDNPRLEDSYPVASTWNAAVMGYVIDALARA
jgi:hypothetical protein